MEIQCTTCHKTIKRSPSLIKDKNFCNHECYSAYKSNNWKGKKNPNWSGGPIVDKCIFCNEKFTTKRFGERRRQKYCSIACAAIHRGMNNCKENHWAWSGGTGPKTKPIRSTAKYKKWIQDVLKRDKHTCKKCGSKSKIEVHHITPLIVLMDKYDDDFYNDGYYKRTNGICLCRECHIDIHKKIGRIAGNPSGAISSRAADTFAEGPETSGEVQTS